MAIAEATQAAIDFLTIDPTRLDAASESFLDGLPFGVIGLSATGHAEVYNAVEIGAAGLRRETVIGQPFFLMAGVCMNNHLVAQRFEREERIDSVLDYVLTFRMRPYRVKLRLLKRADLRRNYLLIKR